MVDIEHLIEITGSDPEPVEPITDVLELEAAMESISDWDDDLGQIRVPVTLATSFLFKNSGLILTLFMLDGRNQEYKELEEIVDWIRNGDPEYRDTQ